MAAECVAASVAAAAVAWALRRRNSPCTAQQPKLTNARVFDDVGGYIGLDIGGSLAKLVYFEPDESSQAASEGHLHSAQRISAFIRKSSTYGTTGVRDTKFQFHSREMRGTFHFLRFETARMESAVDMIKNIGLHHGDAAVHVLRHCTGGGAHKFAKTFKQKAGLVLHPVDEMSTLVRGMAFLLEHFPAEAYSFSGTPGRARSLSSFDLETPRPACGQQYPFLLVNVGSGVSFLLVESRNSWRRVSGTSVGGGTFYGLCHMLTGLTSFDDMLKQAEHGENGAVDLLVGDIYGGDYSAVGLKSSTIASSFGGVMHKVRAGLAEQGSDAGLGDATPGTGSGAQLPVTVAAADACRALLIMLSNNIGQLAYLCATQYGCDSVVFAGSFLRHQNTLALRRLAFAIDFWSGGDMHALFLRHEGYFGALGALLLSLSRGEAASTDSAAEA